MELQPTTQIKDASEVRFWKNESGIAHEVIEFEESDAPMYDFFIKTSCGLSYHINGEPGYTYDPEEAVYERVHTLNETERCGNCSWEDLR